MRIIRLTRACGIFLIPVNNRQSFILELALAANRGDLNGTCHR